MIPIDMEDQETSNLIVKVKFYQNLLPKKIQQSGNIAVPDIPNRDSGREQPLEIEVGPDQGRGSSTQRAQPGDRANSNRLMSFGNE